ncbi:hypothetical protein [Streptomyces sp. NPDC006463]|uniref:hypothetical protein n=1 Tax=Streptomyces sp. NPDC006463 TaxID=3364746 RepID=UPI0036804A13
MPALTVAQVGVTGTLLAPVLSQRVLARIQAQQFERQERLADAQWRRERLVTERDTRRACYVTANSGYRRYRLELMNFLWLIHKGEVTPQGRTDLEEARGAMHVSFSEAQMIASDAVLVELDAMAQALASSYSRILQLEEGDPHPEGTFEELLAGLPALGERWKEMRAAMRADLGVDA